MNYKDFMIEWVQTHVEDEMPTNEEWEEYINQELERAEAYDAQSDR